MQRTVAFLRTLFASGVLLAVLLGAGTTLAAPALRYSINQRGDMALIGNTLGQECNNPVTPTVGTIGACGSRTSDTGMDVLWRSDSPAVGQATADTSVSVANARSTAMLSLPAGAVITYARLYWAAAVSTSNSADTTATLDRQGGFTANLTADASFTADGGGYHYYESTADVTTLVQANGTGAYRVGGVTTLDPNSITNETNFAAWSLVVFYTLTGAPPRNLALFDGLDLVQSGDSASATINGFLVPNSGFTGKLGVVAYEGDASITGDSLKFNGTSLSDGSNPSNNFFNGTRSSLGSPVSVAGDLPQQTGTAGSMSGLDLDIVDVTGQLSAGQTSATTVASSSQDTYLLGVFVTSISTLRPIFTETTKSFTDLNGGVIAAGDVIEYTLTTRNTGSDTAIQTLLDDPLPVGVTYVPNSLVIVQGQNPGAKTDAANDDQANYTSANRTVHFRIGAGANGTQGGAVAVGDPDIIVSFRVTVDAGATGVINNQGSVTATGQVGGQVQSFPSSSSGSNGLPTPIVIAPDTTIVSGPPANTQARTANFDFSSSTAGVTYECSLDGAAWAACTDPLALSGLTETAHTLSVRAVIGGVSDPTPASYAWTVDDTSPTTSIDSGPAALSASASATFDFNSNETGVTYECAVDGGAYAACTDPVTFSSLAEGNHTLSVRAKDASGNLDASPATWAWKVDTLAPDTNIVSGPPALTNSTSAPFDFSSTEAGVTYECSLDATVYVACSDPKTFTGLADGAHTLAVRARDGAGNVDPTLAAWAWTVDTTPPDTTINTKPAANTNLTTATFTFTSTEAGSFECQLDGGAFTSCSSGQIYPGLGDGSHTFVVRATDLAGNLETSPATYSWNVDATAPNTTIVTRPAALTNATTAAFTFTATEGGSTFECKLDAGVFGSCVSGKTYSSLTDGSHTFSVRATDGLGNVDATPATYSWTVDATAPNTTLVTTPASPTQVTSAAFTFTATELGSTFECKLDSGSFAACSSGQSYPSLTDGSHTFSVRATDPAGNVDASPASFTWIVDSTAPDTTLVTTPAAVTNATTAAFTFTATEGGSTFQCKLDSGSFTSCTSGQSYPSLTDGSHTFFVRATDGLGNEDATPATYSWTVDTAAPDTTLVTTPAALTNATTAVFTFTATEPGSTFECKLDSGAFAGCSSGESYPDLTDGSHSFAVRATDPAGNLDPTPATFSWTVDATAPETTVASGPDAVTNATSATFDFTSNEAGATFTCSLDGGAFVSCTAAQVFSGLTEGGHTLTVKASDAAGNVDPTPATYSWTVDTSAPDTSIATKPSSPTNASTAVFTFTATEAGSTFECKLDSGAFVGCSSGQSYPTLADGSHTFAVRATDPAGNVDASPASYTWTVDATAPDTTLVTTPSALTNATTAAFTFTATEPGSTFECKLDSGGFVDCSSGQSYSGLVDGSHTFSVRATDGLGNVDATPATFSWTVDTSAPDTSIVTQPSSPTNATTAAFTFTATEPGSTFECKLDAGAFTPCLSGQSYSGLAEESHTFSVRATDPAGNVDASPATYSWTVDVTAPETTIDSGPSGLINLTSADFGFSATEPGATFACSLDGAAFAPCTTPHSDSSLADGPHTFAVQATDAAGNVDPTPASRSWTVDATPPETTVDSGPTGLTAVTNATFTFSANEAASFACSLDAAAFTSCVSPLAFPSVGEGAHTFAVQATDSAGNVDPTAATRSWTVDSTPPDTSIASGPDTVTNSADAAFVFASTETGVTYACSLDGAPFAPCSANPTFPGLADGSHSFAVQATDAAGNVDPTPATLSWTVDTSTPDTTIVSGPPAATNSTTALFELTSNKPGATFDCDLDSAGFTLCPASVSFSGLAEGGHTLVARARDTVGNIDPSPATRSWTVDTTPPGTSIVSGPSGLVASASATFDFDSTESGVTYACSLDGAAFTACPDPVTFASLTDGDHTLEVQATDAAGNVDLTPATQAWTVDTTPPETSIVSGPTGPTNLTSATFAFSASEPGVTYACSLDGAAFTSCPATATFAALAEGAHTLAVQATDAAGNVDPTPATQSWSVDSAAPAAPVITSPANGSTVRSASVTISGTAEANSTVALFLGGAPVATLTADAAGAWSFTPTTLALGAHVATATSTDALGNVSPTSAPDAFTFDPIDTTIDSSTPVVSSSTSQAFDFGSNVAGATFQCSLDGAPFTPCSDPMTFTGLVDGAHLLAVRADDGVGDVDTTPATVSWTVKAHIPAAPLIVRPAQGEVVGTTTPLIVGTAEANSTVQVSIDGAAVGTAPADASGDWSLLTPVALTEGLHAVIASATDAAGQTGPASATTTFTVDLTVLDTFIVSGPTGRVSATSATFDFASNLSPVTYECALDGAAFTDCSTPATFIALGDGEHTVEVRAKDGTGQVDTTPAVQRWTVDTAGLLAPTLTQPSEGASVATRTPALEGGSALQTLVAVQVDGVDVGSTLTDANGHWRLALTTPLSDGAHSAQATASDSFGRASPASTVTHFTVDLTALDTFILSGPPALVSSSSGTFSFDASLLGATFQCSLDGAPFASCSNPATFSGLAEGQHALSVEAVDLLGNVDPSPATWTWRVDTLAPDAPVITSPSSGSILALDTPTLTGTAEPGAWVTVSVDGVVVGTVQANAAGEWSLPPSTPLADGPHQATATASDAAGNVSTDSATVDFLVDTVAPDASITDGPELLVSSTEATFQLASNEAGVSFQCSLDGAAFTACTTPVTFTVAEGQHTLQVRATDGAGNLGAPSATYPWTVDTTPPTVSITGGPTGLTDATLADFTFTASEDVSGFECDLDGQGFSACTAAVSLTGLGDGAHTLQARATDLAGNLSAVASRTWTVDATAPTVSITGGPTGLTNATVADFTLTASEDVSGFECDLDGQGFTACTAAVSLTSLTDGAHTLQARATDLAGNTGGSTSRTWTVDATPPETSIVSGPTGETNLTSATFAFTASESGVTYACSLDGAAFSSCPATATFAALAEGAHTLAVQATDAAGNVDPTPATRSWTVDSAAPNAPIITSPANGSTVRSASVTISGTAEANSTVALFLGGAPVATLTADAAGAWSFTPQTLATGAHVATATSSDALGNVSGLSAPDAFTFDPIDTTIVSGPPALSTSSSGTFSFSSNVATATFDCSLDGAPFAVCTNPVTFAGLIDGAHLLAVRADDGVGDVDTTPATFSWTVQAHVPAAPLIVRPSEGEVVGSATPLIVGTAEANSTVTVVIDGAQVGTTPADSNGDWSLLTPSPLAAGGHTASASAEDASGHTGPFSAVRSFTVDLSVLDTFIVSGPTGLVSTDSATFDFDSNRSPVTYECALDGAAFIACADPVTFDTLADGAHNLSVRAKEAGGDVDTTPALQQWTVTTTPPLAAPVITQPADGASVSTHTPTLEGTSALNTTVAVRVDGTDVGTAITDVNGHWALALTTPLPTGSHTADATATDLSSRVSPTSATTTFTVDPAALDTFILSGPPPLVASASATFSFDASVLGASYQCSLDGAAAAACTNPVTFTGLAEGAHQLSVAASDTLGDVDPSPASWTWSIDTVAPVAPVITSPVDGSTLLTATPAIAGTSEAGAWVNVSVDGVFQGSVQANASGAWLLPPSTPLSDGSHVATATATDAAGNVSGPSAPDTFSVLTAKLAAPTVTTPPNGSTVRTATPALEGTAPAGSTVTVWIDGHSQGVATAASRGISGSSGRLGVAASGAPATTGWSLVPSQPLSEGAHVVTAFASDAYGRTSDSSTPSSFTVDTVAPDTQITHGPSATTAEATADFTLQSDDADATFECSLDGAPFTACTAAVHFDALEDGDHTFEARATDAAGNVDLTPAHFEWTIAQPLVEDHTLSFTGGGCSTTPGGGATSLLLVVLAWFFGTRRRRERASRALAPAASLAVLLVSGVAFAQTATQVPGFDLGTSRLELGGSNNLIFNTGVGLPQGRYRAGFGLELLTQPLQLAVDAEQKGSVVGSRISADLSAAYGLFDWLEVGVSLPIVLHQGGDDLSAYGVESPSAAGLGTPWLHGRLGLLTQGERMPLDLSATVGLGLPIGSQAALAGSGGLDVDLAVGVGRTLNDWLRAGGELGMLIRQSVALGNGTPPDAVGSALRLGAQLSTLNKGLRGEVALRAVVPVTHAPASAELLFGGRMPLTDTLELFAVAGPGIGHTPGTPAFHALVGVAFDSPAGGKPAPAVAVAPPPAVKPQQVQPQVVAKGVVCEAGKPHRAADCPDLDDDGDGTLNKADACPTQPEDKDGYQDQDGCPDPDNDGDGLLDTDDLCPLEAGPKDHHGCPVKDADKDGIEDAQDQCPTEVGDVAHQGCPAPVDTDGDGVPDAEDNCVKLAGSRTNQGCPEKQKQLVVIHKDDLQILDKVYFSTGGSTIQKRSFRLLNQIADVVNGHPNLPTLEVQGHTDNVGKPAKNLVLSQKRADAVRNYLVKKGVPASRLTAKGYGLTRPVESNDTASGREANRRVEFKFVSPSDPAK